MKRLFIIFSALISSPLWALEVHSFQTEYIDLRQVDGQLLGSSDDGGAHSISLDLNKLETSDITFPGQPSRPADILPDGLVMNGNGKIIKAWLGGPSTRYDHGVMLDNIEATRLYAEVGNAEPIFLELPENEVFEDRFPRFSDLDKDGEQELIVIRTNIDSGAGIAVYGLRDGELVLEAASETIGLSHRWLNIVGIEDFNGDGVKEIAAAITPHIGGTLTLFQQRGEKLIPITVQDGYSNHQYGSRELGMSAALDINADGMMDMAVPDAQRKNLILLSGDKNQLKQAFKVENQAAIKSGIYVTQMDKDTQAEFPNPNIETRLADFGIKWIAIFE